MRKRKEQKKLKLEKFKISKLRNSNFILGGDGSDGDSDLGDPSSKCYDEKGNG